MSCSFSLKIIAYTAVYSFAQNKLFYGHYSSHNWLLGSMRKTLDEGFYETSGVNECKLHLKMLRFIFSCRLIHIWLVKEYLQ